MIVDFCTWIFEFLFCPNDWRTLYEMQGTWKRENGLDSFCFFKFCYSKRRNAWKLKLEGELPERHPLYPEVKKIFYNDNDSLNDLLKKQS